MPDRGVFILMRTFLLALFTGFATSLLLGLLVMLGSGWAQASGMPDQPRGGALQLLTVEGRLLSKAPLVHTDVRMQISGMLARVRVEQTFSNPTDEWLEGIYLFPLPEDAAVDHMNMRIGERIIVGEIQEKEQAQRTYQQAKREGRKASLVSQSRPNVFTTAVANIPPHGRIEVGIEYQQSLQLDNGMFAIRFPMVVAPRYNPPAREALAVNGDSAFSTDTVLGAALHNPVTLQVELAPGVPLKSIESPYHAIETEQLSAGRHRIRLADGVVAADRDFELRWSPQSGAAPHAALFREQWGDDHYQLLMVLPPQLDRPLVKQPRELILVLDKSGSMHGDSLQQAKAAVRLALQRLTPDDRFNLIRFDHQTDRLFPIAQRADEQNISLALKYLHHTEADGGTEMLPAMQLALDGGVHADRLRQVVFLTDGAVGNEAELYATIVQRLGDSRLFTVGIGSAPNSYFMTRAAEFGRGSFTYIGRIDEVQQQMASLFNKLESAVLTDIRVDWGDAEVEQWPQRVPDLYAGEPLLLAVRSGQLLGQVTLSGTMGGEALEQAVRLDGSVEGDGIHVLWARRKIRSLMAGMSGLADTAPLRSRVVEVALAHHLVSNFTSLVAVDRTPSHPADDPLQSRRVPRNLPAGWNAQKVFGQLPQTATPASLHLLIGILALLGAGWLRGGRRATGGTSTCRGVL